MSNTLSTGNNDRTSILKAYYGRYLTEVRGLRQSSVRHYYDALNNISRRLKEKNLVEKDIYEIKDLEYLSVVKDIMYADPDFIELNERGGRMYSAGLNNYYRFAAGDDFKEMRVIAEKMDMALPPESPIVIEQTVYRRSNILRLQAFVFADFKCEMDTNHESFIAESTGLPYMEAHHAIPMKMQGSFECNLDVYANIVCLCPICHRRIHYGLKTDRKNMIYQLYDKRAERLANSGLKLQRTELLELIIG